MIDMNSFEAIDSAVFWKDYAALDQLLRSEDVDPRDEDGRTPLMYAILAEIPDLKMIEYLLNHGADANAAEYAGWRPLHFAARDRKPEIVETLLARGAVVDPLDAHGNTPLSHCITSSYPWNPAVADVLLAHGADPYRKNNYGKSPIDVAQTMGKLELVERLKRFAK
jgi:ankyrin repeat protein